ncbi:Hypothetical Protein FCC1311_021712 [Hondaea fermentalgiana]|uniref:cAMP-dependent protein kinase regulatory subunit n=1 Tax=Hondaea fermentalgiana TaxID=2315210 RepID=A0A2R5GCQ4_9STRA|nr:Hypothetical Protein FCC1311_021712 [Hondaea fermentalgiana]|eukprot:GBG25951.1 Hypothetical Protein FCC1311_021712 [Hondaea fermentalgiana]
MSYEDHSLEDEERVTAGCEICTRDDLIERKFHFKPPLFLQNTTDKINGKSALGAGERWSLKEGVVGSNPGQNYVFKCEDVAPTQASIYWQGTSDDFLFESSSSSTGNYLLLSSARACREAVKLEDGDTFMLALHDSAHEKGSFVRTLSRSKSLARSLSLRNTGKMTSVNPERYVTFKVRIHPAEKSRLTIERKLSKRRAFTTIRSGEAPSLPSLYRQKAEELDLKGILAGFLGAAASTSSEKPHSKGSLLTPEEVRTLQQKHRAGRNNVVFVGKVGGETTEATTELDLDMNTLQRNIYGGSSVLEEEAILDAVWCDTEVPVEQLDFMRAATNQVGVSIESAHNSGQSRATEFEMLVSDIASKRQHELDSLFRRRVELEIVDGPPSLKGSKRGFGVHDISIGSHRMSDFRIEGLSGFHARIERDNENNFWLRDLAVDQTLSTLLVLGAKRPVSILPGDIFRLGKHCEVTAYSLSDLAPSEVNETWDCLALRVCKTRKSLRYRQLGNDERAGPEPSYFIMSPSVEDIVIGRKVLECDIAVKDYEMPPYAASISCYDRKFFVSAMPESRKKGVFIELSRRVRDPNGFNGKGRNSLGRLHLLERGDTIKLGRSQLTVALKKVEEADAVAKRRSESHAVLRRVRLFAGLQESELHLLASSVCTMEFGVGDILIRQGSKVTGMLVIGKGEAHVFHESAPSKILNKVKADNVLGEMSLFSASPASASVRAATPMVCLYVDFYLAKAIIHPSNFEIIRTLVDHRTTQANVHDLQQIPYLENVDSSRLLLLSRRLFRVELSSPTQLFRVGDEHECMYIVSSGTLYVSRTGAEDRPTRRGSYKPLSRRSSFTPVRGGGNIFSEMLESALIRPEEPFKAPYAVATNAEVILYGLLREDFIKIMSMSDESVREETEHCRINIRDLLPAHFASSRRQSLAPQMLVRSGMEDGAPSQPGAETPSKRISNDKNFSFKTVSRGSIAIKAPDSTRILPGEFAMTSAQSERLRPSRRHASLSSSQSVDEGAEGDTLAYIERLVSANAPAQSSGQDSQAEEQSATDVNGERLDDDADTISLASTETADMSDLEDAEILTDNETFDDALFSKRSDLEARLHGLTLAEIERELAKEPFYLVLKCIAGPQKRQLFILTKALTIIGRWTSTSRDEEAKDPLPGRRVISLNDRTVSRVNSIVQYRSGDFFLNDVESKYGTHLKLKAHEDLKLEVGDVVSCSQHEFEVFARVKLQFSGQTSSCCSIL